MTTYTRRCPGKGEVALKKLRNCFYIGLLRTDEEAVTVRMRSERHLSRTRFLLNKRNPSVFYFFLYSSQLLRPSAITFFH